MTDLYVPTMLTKQNVKLSSEKAVLFKVQDAQIWVPRSLMREHPDGYYEVRRFFFEDKAWFFRKAEKVAI